MKQEFVQSARDGVVCARNATTIHASKGCTQASHFARTHVMPRNLARPQVASCAHARNATRILATRPSYFVAVASRAHARNATPLKARESGPCWRRRSSRARTKRHCSHSDIQRTFSVAPHAHARNATVALHISKKTSRRFPRRLLYYISLVGLSRSCSCPSLVMPSLFGRPGWGGRPFSFFAE